MIILDVLQGSDEWVALRAGIPTASRFDEIITPKTMKPSQSRDKYMHELIAEQLGHPKESATSQYIERGTDTELKAVRYYEMERGVDTEQVGFVLRDDRKVGCSPDRLVGSEGLLEIKCPAPHIHIGYLLDEQGIGYKAQCQGQLWLTDRSYIDTLSYSPVMPPALVRQARDEVFIKALAAAVDQFISYMEESKEKLIRRGLFKAEDFEKKPFVQPEAPPMRKHRFDPSMDKYREPQPEGVKSIDPFFAPRLTPEQMEAKRQATEARLKEVGL